MERQLVAKATGCFWFRARRKLAFVRGRNRKQASGLRPQLPFHCLARTPREGAEMPQAQRRGISLTGRRNLAFPAKQPHIGTAYRSARRTGILVRLFGDGAGDVPKTGTTPAKMGQNEGNVPETGTSPAVRPFSPPETGAFHLQN